MVQVCIGITHHRLFFFVETTVEVCCYCDCKNYTDWTDCTIIGIIMNTQMLKRTLTVALSYERQ